MKKLLPILFIALLPIFISCRSNKSLKENLESEYISYVSFDFLSDGGSAMWGFRAPNYHHFYIITQHSISAKTGIREIEMKDYLGENSQSLLITNDSKECKKLLTLLKQKPFIAGSSRLDQTNIYILIQLIENRNISWKDIKWQRFKDLEKNSMESSIDK